LLLFRLLDLVNRLDQMLLQAFEGFAKLLQFP
jgi:hypothetical protein